MNDNELSKNEGYGNSSPKFYTKSLTLVLPILEMIESGLRESEIAKKLNSSKQSISYHISKLKELGYVRENRRDVFKIFELTQRGKNFLAMYQSNNGKHPSTISTPIFRVENVRFRAPVYKLPQLLVDWNKVGMHNWTQYTKQLGSVKVKLNKGTNPSIEFIPAAIDGNDPIKMYFELFQNCNDVANMLEEVLDIKIGRLQLTSKGEWIVYNPLARTITEYTGRITVDGIGKINASLPNRIGEFEFFDPRAAAEFTTIPRRLANLERDMKKLLKYLDLREPN